MLLQFSIKNFKNFKEKTTLSLVATNYDKDTHETNNIYHNNTFNLRILNSAAIYGANASGKSKLFDALIFMKHFVISSSKESQQGDTINIEPFRLNTKYENSPTEFEIIFIFKNIMYRYGFEANKEKIISEWLYYKPKNKEIKLFLREGDIFETHTRKFTKGKAVINENLVRDNALLVTVSAQFNEETAIAVITWFKNLKTISGLNESGYHGYTMSKTTDLIYKEKILNLLIAADLGIQDIIPQKFDISTLPSEMPKEIKEIFIQKIKDAKEDVFSDVLISHKTYDTNNQSSGIVNFSLDKEESSGTRKFFALTGPILDVLENGYTIVIDELDSKLHPNLVCKIVSLFNSKELNTKNAQLIFNTHNTNLLGSNLFRRDQIWFTEKNKYGASILYSLADFKSNKVRKKELFQENYIVGKYGAVPYVNSFDYINLSNSNLIND